MEYIQTKNRHSVWIILSVFFLLTACGGGEGPPTGSGSNTGSVIFKLVWQNAPPTLHDGPPSGDVCQDYLIESINVALTDKSNAPITAVIWPCSDHGGTIKDVPQGTGITITIDGFVAGNPDWRGQVAGFTIKEDTTNDAGTIVMSYNGGDVTPPTVTSHNPGPGDFEILLNAAITANFSENVVAASLNSTSCSLHENGTTTQVAHSLSYDAANHVVRMKPDNDLKPNTDYTATITTIVEDLAGLHLASNETWTFTTGEEVGQSLIWDTHSWNASLWE